MILTEAGNAARPSLTASLFFMETDENYERAYDRPRVAEFR